MGVDAAAGLELRDRSDLALAVGATGFTNLSRVISNFVIATTGTYYARVTGWCGPRRYSLLVTRNTAFDLEPNDSFAGGQSDQRTGRGARGDRSHQHLSGSGSPVRLRGHRRHGDRDCRPHRPGRRWPPTSRRALRSACREAAFPRSGSTSNGLITFGGLDASFTNGNLTTAPTFATIAPFWDDLFITGSGASSVRFQVLGVGLDQHLTIQWHQISFFSGGTAGDTLTFQAQLYVDGRIRFNYLDLLSGGAAGNNGGSASVGIKAAGTQGPNRLLLAQDVVGGNAFVGTGRSTLISLPPGEDWYSVNVTNPASRHSCGNGYAGRRNGRAGQPAQSADRAVRSDERRGGDGHSAAGRPQRVHRLRAVQCGTIPRAACSASRAPSATTF